MRLYLRTLYVQPGGIFERCPIRGYLLCQGSCPEIPDDYIISNLDLNQGTLLDFDFRSNVVTEGRMELGIQLLLRGNCGAANHRPIHHRIKNGHSGQRLVRDSMFLYLARAR